MTAGAAALHVGRAADASPNVLFITVDQMRGDCLSLLGHPNARTPSLDRMAREGVLFRNGFASGPVCVPSRKSCFSGLHPHEHGSMTNNQGEKLNWNDSMLEYFATRGYKTAWVGKNHTYDYEAIDRLDKADIRSREAFRAYNGYVPPHWHSAVYWPEEQCFPHINTRSAIDFLSNVGNEPFFLHVSYFDPHPPYMAPARFTSRYCSDDIVQPDRVNPAMLSSRFNRFCRAMGSDQLNPADLTETMRYYYAQIEWGVDEPVGQLFRALEAKGLADNTIVVLTSDHGDFMGDYGTVRKGMFLYDSLLHVPLLWWAPGRIASGLLTDELAQSTDLFPTLVELTGGSPPQHVSGRSLAKVLKQDRSNLKREAIFTSAAYGDLADDVLPPNLAPDKEDGIPRHTQVLNPTMRPMHRTKMVRTQEWKMILNETEPPELYHLAAISPRERLNLADMQEHVAVRKKMENQLNDWWAW